jgi:hypothetical protein
MLLDRIGELDRLGEIVVLEPRPAPQGAEQK